MTNDRRVWSIVPMGDSALLLQPTPPTTEAVGRLVALAHEFERRAASAPARAALTGWTLGLDTLLVTFDPLVTDEARLRRWLLRRLAALSTIPQEGAPLVEIPVRYGGTGGPDLAAVAAAAVLSEDEVIALHTSGSYRVLMVGFAPGFPYIGGLPARLRLPRRARPRTHVPPGSVAIAEDMVGIYPQRSPGGWHLIGHTSLALFDPQRNPPALLQPGDAVRFVRV